MSYVASAQDATAPTATSENANDTEAPSKASTNQPKTFTEAMRTQRENAKSEQTQAMEAATKRAKTYGVLPEGTEDAIRIPYEEALAAFQKSLVPVRRLHMLHQVAWKSADDFDRLHKFSDACFEAHTALIGWSNQLAKTYAIDPEKFVGLRDMMEEMVLVDASGDRFESLGPIAKALFEHSKDPSDELLEAIGYVGYATCDFDLAEAAWKKLDGQKKIGNKLRTLLDSIPELRTSWQREQEFRKSEAASNINPQVLILTNKGEIVVELFEDQAPQAVANFIFLVERKFYKHKSFFRVKQHLSADTGCDRSDGSGNAGYSIPGEMQRKDHRSVFRGSLVYRIGVNKANNQIDYDSGSSQFFISMLPQPRLDGEMTVFGRVVKGEQWLGTLARMDLSDEKQKKDKSKKPDFIIEAKVLRKREHRYVPEISGGRLP